VRISLVDHRRNAQQYAVHTPTNPSACQNPHLQTAKSHSAAVQNATGQLAVQAAPNSTGGIKKIEYSTGGTVGRTVNWRSKQSHSQLAAERFAQQTGGAKGRWAKVQNKL
jgi:hypothetical protein